MRKFPVLGTVAIFAWLSCQPYQEVSKQLPTFAKLQSIAQQLQRRADSAGAFSESEAREVMEQYNGGLDEWGEPFRLELRYQPSFSFLVLSTGSDRALDVSDASLYFDRKQTDVVGQLEKDIVFQDGRPITIASAK